MIDRDPPLIGFLEEMPAVRSMARLGAAIGLALIGAIVAAICYVAVAKSDPAATIAALGAVLVPLAGTVWSSLRERTPAGPAPIVEETPHA
jgi:uncharacterized MnhB-related membrane protein